MLFVNVTAITQKKERNEEGKQEAAKGGRKKGREGRTIIRTQGEN
jgi:hypothetical protein